MAERVASPVFVGREAELAVLVDALDRPERVGAVLVGGEAGAGKSRLVAELAARATAGGSRVVVGGCVALGAESLPFAPFVQALAQLFGGLGPAEVDAVVGPARPGPSWPSWCPTCAGRVTTRPARGPPTGPYCSRPSSGCWRPWPRPPPWWW